MKNSNNIILTIVFILFSTALTQAYPTDLLIKGSSEFNTLNKLDSPNSIKDNAAIKEITKHLQKHSSFSFEKLHYLNQIKLEIQVDLDKNGTVTSYKVLNNQDVTITNSITKAMATLSKVDPIVIGGLPRAQRLVIPLTITP